MCFDIHNHVSRGEKGVAPLSAVKCDKYDTIIGLRSRYEILLFSILGFGIILGSAEQP